MPVSPEFWKSLNGGWPEGIQKPTDAEAINGVKRLYRLINGEPLQHRIKIVRGDHRHTWGYGMRLNVGPDAGWPAIVHLFSHWIHRRMPGYRKPHDSRQARIEKEMQRYVIEHLL